MSKIARATVITIAAITGACSGSDSYQPEISSAESIGTLAPDSEGAEDRILSYLNVMGCPETIIDQVTVDVTNDPEIFPSIENDDGTFLTNMGITDNHEITMNERFYRGGDITATDGLTVLDAEKHEGRHACQSPVKVDPERFVFEEGIYVDEIRGFGIVVRGPDGFEDEIGGFEEGYMNVKNRMSDGFYNPQYEGFEAKFKEFMSRNNISFEEMTEIRERSGLLELIAMDHGVPVEQLTVADINLFYLETTLLQDRSPLLDNPVDREASGD